LIQQEWATKPLSVAKNSLSLRTIGFLNWIDGFQLNTIFLKRNLSAQSWYKHWEENEEPAQP
jgi:hypothetical protein